MYIGVLLLAPSTKLRARKEETFWSWGYSSLFLGPDHPCIPSLPLRLALRASKEGMDPLVLRTLPLTKGETFTIVLKTKICYNVILDKKINLKYQHSLNARS